MLVQYVTQRGRGQHGQKLNKPQYPSLLSKLGKGPGSLAPIEFTAGIHWLVWLGSAWPGHDWIMRLEQEARLLGQCAESITNLSSYVDDSANHPPTDHDRHRLHFALLRYREANRAISVLLRERKRRVQSAKGALDRTELVRQNLLYEKRHLESSIRDTRNHPSLFLTIPLQTATPGEPGSIEYHEQMLLSLRTELSEKRELADRLKSKQESLELAKSRLVLKRKELEKIRDQLELVVRAGDPFLHSHARFFVELERATSQSQSKSDSLLLLGGEEKDTAALERLLQHWIAFCESEQGEGIQVSMFDELEAGEDFDPSRQPHDNDHDNDNEHDTDEDEARSLSALGSEDALAPRAYSRFESQNGRPARRFGFAYLSVLVPVGPAEKVVTLLFYRADQQDRSAPLVLRVESEGEAEMAKPEGMESVMLALNVDPVMKLTIPHESIVPGAAGHVPFRWIQSLAGLMPDASFSEPQRILLNLCNAVRQHFGLEAQPMQVDEAPV